MLCAVLTFSIQEVGMNRNRSLEADVFAGLISRDAPEAKGIRQAAIVYTRIRDVVNNMGPHLGEESMMLAREKLANAERALVTAAMAVAVRIVNGGEQ